MYHWEYMGRPKHHIVDGQDREQLNVCQETTTRLGESLKN